MSPKTLLKNEIERLKIDMQNKAMELNFDFTHPDVLSLSEQLDNLIVKCMKLEQQSNNSKVS